jgi:hypothetical protein
MNEITSRTVGIKERDGVLELSEAEKYERI